MSLRSASSKLSPQEVSDMDAYDRLKKETLESLKGMAVALGADIVTSKNTLIWNIIEAQNAATKAIAAAAKSKAAAATPSASTPGAAASSGYKAASSSAAAMDAESMDTGTAPRKRSASQADLEADAQVDEESGKSEKKADKKDKKTKKDGSDEGAELMEGEVEDGEDAAEGEDADWVPKPTTQGKEKAAQAASAKSKSKSKSKAKVKAKSKTAGSKKGKGKKEKEVYEPLDPPDPVPRPTGEAVKKEESYLGVRHGKTRSKDGPAPACPFYIEKSKQKDYFRLNKNCGHSITEWCVSPSTAKEKHKKAQFTCRCSEITCDNCPICRGVPLAEDDEVIDMSKTPMQRKAECPCLICQCDCSKTVLLDAVGTAVAAEIKRQNKERAKQEEAAPAEEKREQALTDVASLLALGATSADKDKLTAVQSVLKGVLRPPGSFELPAPKRKATFAVDAATLITAVDDAKEKNRISQDEYNKLELLAAAGDQRITAFYKAWLVDAKPSRPEKFGSSLKNLANSISGQPAPAAAPAAMPAAAAPANPR